MIIPYQAATPEKTSFNCPICQVYASQKWVGLFSGNNSQTLIDWRVCHCQYCSAYTLWYKQKMYFPAYGGVQPPNPDLSDDIQSDYQEAATIVNQSPRGASAILRLALQKLCKQLGEKGENINEDIKALVKEGLPVQVQQALDIVRVIGNNAVHPGQLDLKDDTETAIQLFALLNIIAESMITQPKRIQALYDVLPASTKEAIEKRDK